MRDHVACYKDLESKLAINGGGRQYESNDLQSDSKPNIGFTSIIAYSELMWKYHISRDTPQLFGNIEIAIAHANHRIFNFDKTWMRNCEQK